MPATVIAVDEVLEPDVEPEPTEIETSVTHDAPWLPHDLTCNTWEPVDEDTVALIEVL